MRRSTQLSIIAPPIVEWDCSPEAKGVCLCLDCPDNMIGYEQRENGTLVIGGGSGEGRGVTIPLRTVRAGVMRLEDVEAKIEEASTVAAELGDRLYERIGTTCKRDLARHADMTQDEVGAAMGMTRQAVAKLERSGLGKLRRRREMVEAQEGGVENWGMAEGCRRR